MKLTFFLCFFILLSIFEINTIFCDAPEPYQVWFQDPATINMEWMASLHEFIMFDIVCIVCLVFFALYQMLTAPHEVKSNFTKTQLIQASNKAFSHSQNLEIIWTILPAVVLLAIASPTFSLLYAMDDYVNPAFVLKITGHQWYWSYEYIDYAISLKPIRFDSYMVNTQDLRPGTLRLLETDTRVILPCRVHVRLLATSADVIHSWAIPSFGIKIDACPGRLTQVSIFIKRPGLYFGQCSEICGVNHGFMPIVVRAIEPYFFFGSRFKSCEV